MYDTIMMPGMAKSKETLLPKKTKDAYKLDKLSMALPWLLTMIFILPYKVLLSKLFIMKQQKHTHIYKMWIYALLHYVLLKYYPL